MLELAVKGTKKYWIWVLALLGVISIGFAVYLKQLSFGLGLEKELNKLAVGLIAKLYKIFMEKDATLVEINPLVITKDNRLIALDAKMTFDDNALLLEHSNNLPYSTCSLFL